MMNKTRWLLTLLLLAAFGEVRAQFVSPHRRGQLYIYGGAFPNSFGLNSTFPESISNYRYSVSSVTSPFAVSESVSYGAPPLGITSQPFLVSSSNRGRILYPSSTLSQSVFRQSVPSNSYSVSFSAGPMQLNAADLELQSIRSSLRRQNPSEASIEKTDQLDELTKDQANGGAGGTKKKPDQLPGNSTLGKKLDELNDKLEKQWIRYNKPAVSTLKPEDKLDKVITSLTEIKDLMTKQNRDAILQNRDAILKAEVDKLSLDITKLDNDLKIATEKEKAEPDMEKKKPLTKAKDEIANNKQAKEELKKTVGQLLNLNR